MKLEDLDWIGNGVCTLFDNEVIADCVIQMNENCKKTIKISLVSNVYVKMIQYNKTHTKSQKLGKCKNCENYEFVYFSTSKNFWHDTLSYGIFLILMFEIFYRLPENE